MSTMTSRLLSLGIALSALAACSGDRPGSTATSAPDQVTAPPTEPLGSSEPGSSASQDCRIDGEVTTVQYRELPEVPADSVSLDVYGAAPGCGAPVVIWVHGGGYQVGDKRNQIDDKVALAQAQGWVLVSVNYRLTDPADPASARFPDHYDDVAHAIGWVHDHVDEHGGDPSRVALLGHSAGADIVSNVATVPTYLEAVDLGLEDLRCAGPLDTAGFDKTAPVRDAEDRMWEQALGNEPDYRTLTSATLHVRPGIGIPPMIGVVRGGAARRAVETAFLAALDDAGIHTVTIEAGSLSHAEVNNRIGASGDTVMTPPLVAFLAECFAG